MVAARPGRPPVTGQPRSGAFRRITHPIRKPGKSRSASAQRQDFAEDDIPPRGALMTNTASGDSTSFPPPTV